MSAMSYVRILEKTLWFVKNFSVIRYGINFIPCFFERGLKIW
jgi:hypothetical protein